MYNPFARKTVKTVASIVSFLTNALDDLNKVSAEHQINASAHDDLVSVHQATASSHRAEADRASTIASNLRKLLA